MAVPTGPLATLGSAMGKVVALEQKLSTALNAVAAVLPSFPAVRITDMDIGLPHAHAHPPNLVPPAPPVPLPSTGPVIPIPIFSGASNTQINGIPAARCGDMGLGIWCGGYFPMYEIFLGSSNVWIEGARAARIGVDITKHCIFTSPKPQDPPIGPMVGFTVTASSNVLIGGVPMPSLFALAFGAALKVFGKVLKAGARAARRLGQRLGRNMKPGFIKCTILRAEPVNTVTGEVVVDQQDFSLPGRIPLEWTRHYSSQSDRAGSCGYGWETPADARLEFEPDGSVIFYDGGPGASIFLSVPTTEPVLALVDGALLTKTYDTFTVRTKAGLLYRFLRQLGSPKELLVESITDRCGNFWRFSRHGRDLYEIVESAGRTIEVNSWDGRIEQLSLRDRDTKQPHVFVRYEYDQSGNLITVYDALNAPYRFAYKNHCLVQHTDRNRLSFYYEFDQYGVAGRCTHSWGDGGLYEYHFDYLQTVDKDLNFLGETRITDSLGNIATLRYDDRNLVLEEVDPLGGVTKYEYDEAGRTSAVIDPAGNRTEYQYDERGNLTKLTRPDGIPIITEYDTNSFPAKTVDPNGNAWLQDWGATGLLSRRVSPTGAVWAHSYNERGDLLSVTDPLGHVTYLRSDSVGNISSFRDSLGHESHFELDARGNTLSITDPTGAKIRYRYDPKSRLIGATYRSGRSLAFAYDPGDNLTVLTNGNQDVTRIEYTGLGQVAKRIQANGTVVSYRYDTEENLIGVVNERGEKFTYVRDARGRVLKEIDYWGNVRERFFYPNQHRACTTDALGRKTTYEYDVLGRTTAIHRFDNVTETFTYDANGNLIAAKNGLCTFTRVFDKENHLVEESQQDYVIRNEYDLRGNRIKRQSSRGVTVTYDYDSQDRMTAVGVNLKPLMWVQRDARGMPIRETLGARLERRLTYNDDGQLVRQELRAGGAALGQRSYRYDPSGNLTERADSRKGRVEFTYDPLGRILEHIDPAGKIQRYFYDAAGDLLRSNPDGEILPGDRRADYEGVAFTFDTTGNMIARKVQGQTTTFSWDGDNRLISASEKNCGTTTMGYDPLGRRLFKETEGQQTLFEWDGEQLLADDKPGQGRREFIYYPDTFEPLAVICSDGEVYYFENDAVGLPHELHDRSGNIAWSARYSATGQVDEISVEKIDNPLRFPGQYYDPEIQLCYNRQRYFEPVLGSFVSPDPLGLLAGTNLYAYAPNPWVWIDPLGLTCVAGQHFKDHFIRHKHLLETLLGKRYPKWKLGGGQQFLDDVNKLVYDGQLTHAGMGTLKAGQPAMDIFRGQGLTLVTTRGRPPEFVTLLQSGQGLDKGIQMVPGSTAVPAGSWPI